mmetsp:Transcript_25332/g.45679  ORF Transcript_25332/g.45679 Transcript_25332/m.45679 type:complete len:230 (-) Transcript_25332:2558-3247(-)
MVLYLRRTNHRIRRNRTKETTIIETILHTTDNGRIHRSRIVARFQHYRNGRNDQEAIFPDSAARFNVEDAVDGYGIFVRVVHEISMLYMATVTVVVVGGYRGCCCWSSVDVSESSLSVSCPDIPSRRLLILHSRKCLIQYNNGICRSRRDQPLLQCVILLIHNGIGGKATIVTQIVRNGNFHRFNESSRGCFGGRRGRKLCRWDPGWIGIGGSSRGSGGGWLLDNDTYW